MKGTVLERFEAKYIPEPMSGCWLWIGAPCGFGYGHFAVSPKLHVKAHRFSWELVNGPIPQGLWVLHHCDNPPCVNPQHLFLGTRRDNAVDSYIKGRSPILKGALISCARRRARTHCKWGHLYNAENTIQLPSGRDCKACQRIRSRNWAQRQKELMSHRRVYLEDQIFQAMDILQNGRKGSA